MSRPRITWGDLPAPFTAAVVSLVVGFGGTFILIAHAARAAGMSAEMTASWVWAMSIGTGVSGLYLSWRYREPIVTAWSTPGAAFLVSALAVTPLPEAIGAYMVTGLAFVALGVSGYFERAIRLVPPGIAAGLLAGILLQFGIGAFGAVAVDPWLVGVLVVVYALLKRFTARYAVVGLLAVGLAMVSLRGQFDVTALTLTPAMPVWVMPEFSAQAMLSVALPLFLITLTGQYTPGMIVLRADGYRTSANPILVVTGLGSLLSAPFGAHTHNLAAITAAICTGRGAHEDPRKRYLAGMFAGGLYILIGVFGVTLAALFLALPAPFVATLAGLALLGPIGGNLAAGMADAQARETALITFLAAAANITMLGIGGAFWGLVIGLVAHGIMHGRRDAR